LVAMGGFGTPEWRKAAWCCAKGEMGSVIGVRDGGGWIIEEEEKILFRVCV